MAALTTPGGAVPIAGTAIAPASYFHPRAVTLSRAGVTLTLPNNPTKYTGKFGTVLTNRTTLDGIATYVWSDDVNKFTLVGRTAWEGLSVVKQIKAQMRGKADVQYHNDLDVESGTVVVTDVQWDTVEGTVMTWEYTIQLQQAQALPDTVAQ